MRAKNILTIIALFTVMLVPSVTYSFILGQPINWTTEDYTVEDYTSIGDYQYDIASDAGMLPILANATSFGPDQLEDAYSDISAQIYGGITDSVTMSTSAFVDNMDPDNTISAMSTARSAFDGTFVAPAFATNLIIDSVIDVTQAYVEGFDANAYAYQHTYVSYMISGGEYSSQTFYYPLSTNGYSSVSVSGQNTANGTDIWDAQTYYIPITAGNTYNISALSVQRAYVEGYATAEGVADLTYSMSVEVGTPIVPEPVSSALFVVGAATLGYSGYRRRKRVS